MSDEVVFVEAIPDEGEEFVGKSVQNAPLCEHGISQSACVGGGGQVLNESRARLLVARVRSVRVLAVFLRNPHNPIGLILRISPKHYINSN